MSQTSAASPVKLKGMTWSHPRGLDPLLAAAEVMRGRGIDVQWDARSLQGFEEASIADLAARYDMIAIDHPFMGQAFAQGALQPVDALLDAGFLESLRKASVGPSYDSYLWQGALWAVPVDAAAQVAAARADLLSAHGLSAPRSWDEVFTLAGALPPGMRIAMPANATHLLLGFATLCHALARDRSAGADLRPAWWTDQGIDRETALHALDLLRRLMAVAHPLSDSADPIDMFEHMARHDDIAYVPVAFGYSNYARPAVPTLRPLNFSAVPSASGEIGAGMLGGVGLAVSRRCTQTGAVAEFLRYVASGDTQAGPYLEAGGQPAHRQAWTAPATERVCPNFFDATLLSLDRSFVRPRSNAFPVFQRDGGLRFHALFHEAGRRDADIVDALNEMWRKLQQR